MSGTSSTTVNGVFAAAPLIILLIPLKDAPVASATGLPEKITDTAAIVNDVAAITPIKALVLFFIKLLSGIKKYI